MCKYVPLNVHLYNIIMEMFEVCKNLHIYAKYQNIRQDKFFNLSANFYTTENNIAKFMRSKNKNKRCSPAGLRVFSLAQKWPMLEAHEISRPKRGRRRAGEHNATHQRDGHGEAEASRARVPAPEEGSSAAGDAAVAARHAPVPLLSGVRPPRPPEDAAFRAPSAQEPRLLSMGSIRRLGFALAKHLRCLA